MKTYALIAVTAGLVFSAAALADDARTVRVQFEPGARSAVVTDRIRGRDYVLYKLKAQKGQFLTVRLLTSNQSANFNIYITGCGPGDEALFTSDTGGREYRGQLYVDGDHTVSVFLNRNAARKGMMANYDILFELSPLETPQPDVSSAKSLTGIEMPAAPEDGGPRNWEVTGATGTLNLREQPSTKAGILARYAPGTILDNLGCRRAEGRIWCDVQQLGGGPRGYVAAEYLKPAVSPDGSAATGPDDSALRAGQGEFDANGNIPCAQTVGQPMMQCEFGVARAGGGYATVVIKRPDGRTRAIFFRMGIPIGADTSQADGYPELRATKEGDLHLIRIGNERYEIPDAVVLGG